MTQDANTRVDRNQGNILLSQIKLNVLTSQRVHTGLGEDNSGFPYVSTSH